MHLKELGSLGHETDHQWLVPALPLVALFSKDVAVAKLPLENQLPCCQTEPLNFGESGSLCDLGS